MTARRGYPSGGKNATDLDRPPAGPAPGTTAIKWTCDFTIDADTALRLLAAVTGKPIWFLKNEAIVGEALDKIARLDAGTNQ